MDCRLVAAFTLPLLFLCDIGSAQKLTSDVPYVENGHERQVLDVYTSERAVEGSLPVMFWIRDVAATARWPYAVRQLVRLPPSEIPAQPTRSESSRRRGPSLTIRLHVTFDSKPIAELGFFGAARGFRGSC